MALRMSWKRANDASLPASLLLIRASAREAVRAMRAKPGGTPGLHGQAASAASCPKTEVSTQEYEAGSCGRQRPKMSKLSDEPNGKTEIRSVEQFDP